MTKINNVLQVQSKPFLKYIIFRLALKLLYTVLAANVQKEY